MAEGEASGSEHDASVFNRSWMGKRFRKGKIPLPRPEPLPSRSDGPPIPYTLVGDRTFRETNLMKPFPVVRQTKWSRVLFKRGLCRANATIERAFGRKGAFNGRRLEMEPAAASSPLLELVAWVTANSAWCTYA